VQLFQGQLLLGLVLIVLGFLVGPGGFSIGPGRYSPFVRRAGVAVVVSLLASGGIAACNGGSGDGSGRAGSKQPAAATTSTTAAPTTTTVPTGPRAPRGSGQPVTFASAGDTHFDGQLGTQLQADPNGVLAPVTPVLSGADLAMVNLESAITERGEPVPGKNS
jgi:Bacterial capsule synthesis protein PGA_cap